MKTQPVTKALIAVIIFSGVALGVRLFAWPQIVQFVENLGTISGLK